MKQFILGLSIGVTLWGFVACGVPDHWHPTTDIKQVDNNNAGVCQCKDPTNTIVVKEIEFECKDVIVLNKDRGIQGVAFPEISFEKIVGAKQEVTEKDGTRRLVQASIYATKNGKTILSCNLGLRVKYRLLINS